MGDGIAWQGKRPLFNTEQGLGLGLLGMTRIARIARHAAAVAIERGLAPW